MKVVTTVQQVLGGGPPLGRRTPEPVAACVTIAKRDLRAGVGLDGIGGGACCGMASSTNEATELLPVGLASDATIRRNVPMDRPIKLADVELDTEADLVRLHRQVIGPHT